MDAEPIVGAAGRLGLLFLALAVIGCSGQAADRLGWPGRLFGACVEQAAHDSAARDEGQPFRTQAEIDDRRRRAETAGAGS